MFPTRKDGRAVPQSVEDLYPALFVSGGVYERLWTPGGVSVEELRDLFDRRATAADGSVYASAGMAMLVQRTHCMLSPAMHHLACELMKAQGLLQVFTQFAPHAIESPEQAKAVLQSQPDWQAVLIVGLMLDGRHGYPEARGWVHAAREHMLCGDVAILEVLVRYLRDCGREGVQYLIGPSEASVVAAAELRQFFASSPEQHHELEYDILRVLSARAPVEFLLRGHMLSQRTRMLVHLYSECIRNLGALWASPEQMVTLVQAPWLLPEHKEKLRRAWAQQM